MSSVVFNSQNLHSLVEHHIALLERFNIVNEAPFALIYFFVPNGIEGGEIFQRILRKTDALFSENDHYVAMLPGTDWKGGVDLLSGIQEFLDEKPFDTIVTFPEDGKDATTLVQKLQDLIADNYRTELNMLQIPNKIELFEI